MGDFGKYGGGDWIEAVIVPVLGAAILLFIILSFA